MNMTGGKGIQRKWLADFDRRVVAELAEALIPELWAGQWQEMALLEAKMAPAIPHGPALRMFDRYWKPKPGSRKPDYSERLRVGRGLLLRSAALFLRRRRWCNLRGTAAEG